MVAPGSCLRVDFTRIGRAGWLPVRMQLRHRYFEFDLAIG